MATEERDQVKALKNVQCPEGAAAWRILRGREGLLGKSGYQCHLVVSAMVWF